MTRTSIYWLCGEKLTFSTTATLRMFHRNSKMEIANAIPIPTISTTKTPPTLETSNAFSPSSLCSFWKNLFIRKLWVNAQKSYLFSIHSTNHIRPWMRNSLLTRVHQIHFRLFTCFSVFRPFPTQIFALSFQNSPHLVTSTTLNSLHQSSLQNEWKFILPFTRIPRLISSKRQIFTFVKTCFVPFNLRWISSLPTLSSAHPYYPQHISFRRTFNTQIAFFRS